jgi:5-methylcytosine-specific restriction endonuclease McrA
MIRMNNTWQDSEYDFDKIKEKILNFISKKDLPTIQIYKKQTPITVSSNIKKIFSYIETNIDNLLLGMPNDLKTHIINIENIDEHVKKRNKNPSPINQLIYHLFVELCYDSSNKDKNNSVFNKFNFTESLDINTCPYCNRNYIYTTKRNKLKNEIDHFFPKDKYPYLAISFHNLIPSCKFCNQINVKGAFDTYKEKVRNPYDIKANDFKFTYTIKSVDLNNKVNEFKKNECFLEERNISITFKNKIEGNIKCFKLDEIYEKHTDIIIELICKKMYYPKSYIKQLEGLNFTKEEIYRFLLCNYSKTKDFHKRPLSKLIKDISEELNLI